MQVIANLIAEAIDRYNAEGALKTSNKSLEEEMDRSRKLQQEILDNSMSERWELGGFLHDTLGQKLVAVKMMADGLKRKLVKSENGYESDVDKMQEILDESISEIRDLTHDIIPVDIEAGGVEHAFKELMRQSEELYDIECELNYDEGFTEIKDRKVATNLYLVIQEAVKNAALHGEANRIKISIDTGDELIIKVKDDGSGLPKDRKESDGGGTRIMQHRLDILEGSLQIENDGEGEFGGAVVKCTIPVDGK